MLADGRLMITGGAGGVGLNGAQNAKRVSIRALNGAWSAVAEMKIPRAYHSQVRG